MVRVLAKENHLTPSEDIYFKEFLFDIFWQSIQNYRGSKNFDVPTLVLWL